MKHVKNTSTRPVDLESGPTLAAGEFGHTTEDDPSIEARLLTVVNDTPEDDETRQTTKQRPASKTKNDEEDN